MVFPIRSSTLTGVFFSTISFSEALSEPTFSVNSERNCWYWGEALSFSKWEGSSNSGMTVSCSSAVMPKRASATEATPSSLFSSSSAISSTSMSTGSSIRMSLMLYVESLYMALSVRVRPLGRISCPSTIMSVATIIPGKSMSVLTCFILHQARSRKKRRKCILLSEITKYILIYFK